MARLRSRSGFTFIEILLVLVILGILTGIATPSLREAIFRAEAAKVVSDVRNFKMAVRTYTEDMGTPPASTKWGETPSDMASYISEGMPFSYKGLSYRMVTQTSKKDGTTVRLEIKYSNKDPIGLSLQRFIGTDVTWTKTRTTFWF